MRIVNPIKFAKRCWPGIHLYDKQREILHSLRDNDETYVPGANDMGKDFTAAIAVLWFFCSRRPSRVVTTSVSEMQLEDVLWGEIKRLVDTSKVQLPIRYNHLHIRQVRNDGSLVALSEIRGKVVRQGESFLGRHIPRGPNGEATTLAVFDEASATPDIHYTSTLTWSHRRLILSNPWPCTNFFRKGVKQGDIPSPINDHLYSKVIQMKAVHSPNVRLALQQEVKGEKPTNEILVPGVLDYHTYLTRRKLWDPVLQCIGLDAEFDESGQTLLYPPDWLNKAEEQARKLGGRKAEAIGIDSGEGRANTSMAAVDRLGLIELASEKTPDTSVITGNAIAFWQKHRVKPEDVLFDLGGGGKEHMDRLRRQGHNVRGVLFGATASTVDRYRRMRTRKERREEDEVKYTYLNRRAEMYGILRQLLNPANDDMYALPTYYPEPQYAELRRQLGLMPLKWDGEGRIYLPKKQKKDPNSTEETLTDILGCSPDEADALVLATFGLVRKLSTRKITMY